MIRCTLCNETVAHARNMEGHTLSDRHDDKMKQKSSGVVNIEQKCIQEFDVQHKGATIGDEEKEFRCGANIEKH